MNGSDFSGRPSDAEQRAEVWQCGTHAMDGGSVWFVAATEAVALEWLEIQRREQEDIARNANESEYSSLKWPVPLTFHTDGDSHFFGTLNDTYYARRVAVHATLPERYRVERSETPKDHSPTPVFRQEKETR